MDVSTQAGPTTVVDVQTTGVSWPAIAAGAVAAAALTLALVAFGAGLGLSAISPWADSGVSASTFKTGTGIYLVVVAVMSSAVGAISPRGCEQDGWACTPTRCSFGIPRTAFWPGRSRP